MVSLFTKAKPTPPTPPKSSVAKPINSMKFINCNRNFIVSTGTGFQVCDTANGATKVQASIPGGTALADSYKNSNIFFFVGTGTRVDFPSTKLCIWNAKIQQVVGSVQFSPNLKIVDLHV